MRKYHPNPGIGILTLLVVAALVVVPLRARAAVTFTVTTTADSGAGSLRQAILDANASAGADLINFSIPAAGVHTIVVSSDLPTITDPVMIDGYSQPGTSLNNLAQADNAVLKIELRAAAPSGMTGLDIAAGGSRIQGLAIFDFGGGAIDLRSAGGNVILGNFIGLNASGAPGIETNGIDIFDGSTGNTIGSAIPAERNVISGNDGDGIILRSTTTGNAIQGNFIGVNLAGTGPALNDGDGIGIFGSPSNLIGGTGPGDGNVISGNDNDAIFMDGATCAGNVIQGNLLGTNAAGTAAIQNDNDAIFVTRGAHDNTIGGTEAGAGNLISGNNGHGISFSAFQALDTPNNVVQGNLIGTNLSGTAAIPNLGSGVVLSGSGAVTIGGNAAGARNLISGNLGDGIRTGDRLGLTSSGTIQGNFIGTDVTGTAAVGNGGAGIVLEAPGTSVGGAGGGAGNVIAFNDDEGVICSFSTGACPIRGNSIFSNGRLGINLVGGSEDGFGVTANDPQDPDTGPNALQNSPVLTSASSSGGTTVVQGTLNSEAGGEYQLEFFASPSADASGRGEGKTFLGSISATTNAGGDASFTATLPVATPGGQVISATATSAAGATSEFSNTVALPAVPCVLKAIPRQLNLGTAKVGKRKSKVLRIQNPGRTPLSGSVGSLAAPFVVVSGGGAFTLAPRKLRSVKIEFTPPASGSFNQELVISCAGGGVLNVPVSGKGKAGR